MEIIKLAETLKSKNAAERVVTKTRKSNGNDMELKRFGNREYLKN